MPRPKTHSNINGLLVVDKPVGASSMHVVRKIRSAGGFVKTGHAGTLDPLASGVLLCCVGKATKMIDALMATTKRYEADIDLTAFTQTDDREGEREEIHVDTPPTREKVLSELTQFIGDIEQMPPAFSALHVGGQRAYSLARQGKEVTLGARQVRIDEIHLLDYHWPHARLDIICGKGVYIRSLARDLGQALNTGGHLASLRRTAVGQYTLDHALPLSRFEQPFDQGDVLPFDYRPES